MDQKKHIIIQFSEKIEQLSPSQRNIMWRLIDLCSFILAMLFASWAMRPIVEKSLLYFSTFILIMFGIYILVSRLSNQSKYITRYSDIKDFARLFLITMLSGLVSGIMCVLFFDQFFFRLVTIMILASGVICIGMRILWQSIYHYHKLETGKINDEKKTAILIGAGDGGSLFMETYRRNPQGLNIVGIIDQDLTKQGQVIGGVKVYGDETKIHELAKKFDAKEAIIAIPSLTPSEYEKLFEICNSNNLKVFKMPPVEEVILGLHEGEKVLKKVEIADLLGRKEVELDVETLQQELSGKVILVTGAGGSIGSEICRQVLHFGPRRIVLLGHGENSIYQIYHELQSSKTMVDLYPLIADIQDYERLKEVMKKYKPDIVYHAAAHKHVPLMEMNPVEAYKNNVLGTYNVARAVDAMKVPKMVMISTDKAVKPPNVMGATKRIAELIMTGMNDQSESLFCAVRFGNVLGSRGSVIPVFEKQIAQGGPVTITDFRMVRYFMTIPEASRLVIFAGAHAHGGEVFILDMGDPVKILDLAKKMIMLSGKNLNEIEIIETGIRPGEKLYEELLTSTEHISRSVDEKIFIGKVVVEPMERIDSFIDELKRYSGDELKQKMIDFANQSANWVDS